MDDRPEAILRFWFGDPNGPEYGHYRPAWFTKNDDFDTQIRQHFIGDYDKAVAEEYAGWIAHPTWAVALLLLLDQFPRNLFRGQPQSFASDPKALSVAHHLVTTGADKTLIPVHRFFVYLPFEHSENIEHQHQCVQLMQTFINDFPDLDEGIKGGLGYAIRHQKVIQRFGRFPHRNEILGRQSTPAEIAFLQQPGSRF